MSKCWNDSFISLNFNYDVVHYISTQKQVINYFSVLRHVCRLDTVFCPQYLSFQKWPESQRDRQEKFNSKNRGMTFLTVDVRYLGLLWPINLLFYKWAQQLCFFSENITCFKNYQAYPYLLSLWKLNRRQVTSENIIWNIDTCSYFCRKISQCILGKKKELEKLFWGAVFRTKIY